MMNDNFQNYNLSTKLYSVVIGFYFLGDIECIQINLSILNFHYRL